MKAVFTNTYDGAAGLEYGDRPEPRVQPDSMIIEVEAASVNPVDWKALHGYLKGGWPTIMPLVTGWDVAGTIMATGPAVHGYETGDRVIAYARKDFLGEGTWAQFVNVPERCVTKAPESVDLIHSSALPLAGLTAFQALTENLEIGAGQTVLINGAGGGVGSFAVQIAVALGARVIGTGSESSFERIEQLGATPVPYDENFADAVRDAAPGGIDGYFDLYGGDNLKTGMKLLKKDGRAVTLADATAASKIDSQYVFVKPNRSQLGELVAMVDSGKIKIDVQQTFPLAEAKAAVELSEGTHTHGKIVLTV